MKKACQSGFSGENCQIEYNSLDLCGQNENLCVNGGKCLTIADSRFQCICPEWVGGIYCETRMYKTCIDQDNPNLIEEGAPLCHSENGYCSPGGHCLCKNGFMGESCDIEIAHHSSLKILGPRSCSLNFCNGHGICVENSTLLTCL